MQSNNFSKEEWETFFKVLEHLKESPFENPDNLRLSGLLNKIQKQVKKVKQEPINQKVKEEYIAQIKQTGITQNALQNRTVYVDEPIKNEDSLHISKSRNCYVCAQKYKQLHFHYHKLCPSCAAFNYEQRNLNVDLTGRTVIITGGRVKVGYAAALKFLKSGAFVIITTRFPAIAWERFKQEEDFDLWKDNLHIYGLDLRNLKELQLFIETIKREYTSLDILVNNAAQTIQYPTNYYAPLLAQESKLLAQADAGILKMANNTKIGDTTLALNLENIDKIELNRFGNPVDNRDKNSWNSTLEEISVVELFEVKLINQISPYLLIKEFTPLLKASTFKDTFIINVTSSEGIFSYSNKTVYHPHTNMTKAALNMLTRTSGAELMKSNIWMNAVDVGWISTGAVESVRKKQFEAGKIPPLDPVDGASRIMHPIYEALVAKKELYGQLIKDYKIHDW